MRAKPRALGIIAGLFPVPSPQPPLRAPAAPTVRAFQGTRASGAPAVPSRSGERRARTTHPSPTGTLSSFMEEKVARRGEGLGAA
ncbi:hypothetical protein E1J22_20870 [Xanthomonas citri]|nr:hypothetical protein [Xanthomonas citri]